MSKIEPDLGVAAELQQRPFADDRNQAVWKEVHAAMGLQLHFHEGKKIELRYIDGKPHGFYPANMRLWEFTNFPGSREPMARFGENMRAIGVSIARSIHAILHGKESAEILAREFYAYGVGLMTGHKAKKRSLKHIASRIVPYSNLVSVHDWLSDRGLHVPESNHIVNIDEAEVAEIEGNITERLVEVFGNIATCLRILNNTDEDELEQNVTACQKYVEQLRAMFVNIIQYPKRELLDGMLNTSKGWLLEDLNVAIVDNRIPGFRRTLEKTMDSISSLSAASALVALGKVLEEKGGENALGMIASYILEKPKPPEAKQIGMAPERDALVPLAPTTTDLAEVDEPDAPITIGDGRILKPSAAKELVRMLTSAPEEQDEAMQDPRDAVRLESGYLCEVMQVHDFQRQLFMARQVGAADLAALIEHSFAQLAQLAVSGYEYQRGHFSVQHAQGHTMNCVGKSIAGSTLLQAVGIHHLTACLHNVPHAVDLLITSDGKVHWCDMGCPKDNEELTDADLIGVTVADILKFHEEGNGSLYFELKPRKKHIHGSKKDERFRGSIFHPNVGHNVMMFEWIASGFQCKGQHEEAISLCKIGLDVCNDGLYGHMGRSLAALGRKEELVALTQEAAEKVPNDVGCLYDLGRSLISVGEYQSAVETFGRVLEKEPEHRYVHYNIGCCYAAMGQHRMALTSYGKAMKHGMEMIFLAPTLLHSLRQLGEAALVAAIIQQVSGQERREDEEEFKKDEIWEYFEVWEFEK